MSTQPLIPVDTLISARWIIPIRPAARILENHAIAIRDGAIVDILPRAEALLRFDPNHGIELPQHALTPGLINAHGHAAMTLFRGMADDMPLQSWLQHHIWPAEAQWVNEAFIHDGTQLAIAEMLRSGTTTFSDMYFYPDIVAKAASDAGIRAQISFPVLDFATVWAQDPDDYIRKGLDVRDNFKHSELIDVVFGPHAPYTVNDQALKKIAMLADELDCGIQIHAHETAEEIRNAIKLNGKRPLARLDELGIITPRTQLVHMTTLNDADIELVKAGGAHVIHCPQSNLKLASGLCPVNKLLQNGINVALGSDGAASNNNLDMFSELRTAALLTKVSANDATSFSSWQALETATLGGARALGIDSTTGSLEPGKQADIIAIDLSSLEQQPVYQPVSQLVYTPCGHHVSHSWVQGKLVMADRKPLNLDLKEITQKALQWKNKLTTKH